MEEYDVRPQSPNLITSNFSGGNQQKIILSRELNENPKVLLVGQPTRGVDIGAIEFIHQRLIDMRDRGAAILLDFHLVLYLKLSFVGSLQKNWM